MSQPFDANINPVPDTDPYNISVPGNALALSARINRLIQMDRFQRQQFEREWFRNVLFIAGNQWIVYDRGKWRPKNVPTWFPRAMTNKCSEKVNDFVTTLLQSGRVPINYLPSRGDDEEDKAIAEVGERIRDVMYEEAGIEDESIMQTLGSWVGACGNGFLIPYYDLDPKYGTASIDMQACAQCGAQATPQDIQDSGGYCPKCGGIAFQPATDEDGNKVTQDFNVGRFRTDVCSPFEIRWDHRITSYSEHKRFTRMRMWDLDLAKEKYKDVANQITADHENDLGQFYLNALAHVTASFGQTGGFIGGASNPLGPKTVVYEHYELPDDYYPEGIKCTRVGANSDLIVEAGPLPSEYTGGPRKGQKFLPLIHFGFDIVPGRLWRKTRLDDVIPLQIFRNMVEASLRLTAQRMSNPVWLNPKGSGISIFTGEPGQVFDYNPMSVGGTSFAKPERVPAELSNVGPLIQLMNKTDDSIERVMGTFFLQGGECVTPDTECLTKRGWTHQDSLNIGDEVYALDPKTGVGVWTPVSRIYRDENYFGPMHQFSSQTISGMFTPKHDWVVGNLDKYQYRETGKGRPRTRPSGLFKVPTTELKTHQYIPAGFGLAGNKEKYPDALVKMLGWVVTDGHYQIRKPDPAIQSYKPRYTVSIAQSATVNAPKCEMIRLMLRENNLAFSENEKQDGGLEFCINGIEAKKFMDQFPDKRVPLSFIHELSQRQLLLLVDTMMLGDGSSQYHDGTRKHRSLRYTSSDPILADQFQMIATLAGYTTRKSRRDKHRGPTKRPRTRYEDAEYRITLKATKKINVMRALPKRKNVLYSGLIWCPTTGTGNWVARHNGCVYLTGNSPPGVTAASALAYLGEKAQRSMAAPMRSWALGWKQWEEMGLEIMRGNATDERMLTIAGKNREWETQKFKFSELTGSVKMRIDYNGLMPKSIAAERANIGQLIQLKVLDPTDPEVGFHILEAFGETNLKGSIDVAVREAVKENEKFVEMPDYHPVVVPIVQNDQVHIMQHKDLCNTDEFKALPEQRQHEMFQHIQNHFADMMMQQQMIQQAAAAAQGQGAPGAPGPGGPTPPAGPQGPEGTDAIQQPRVPDIAGDVAPGEPPLPAGGGA